MKTLQGTNSPVSLKKYGRVQPQDQTPDTALKWLSVPK